MKRRSHWFAPYLATARGNELSIGLKITKCIALIHVSHAAWFRPRDRESLVLPCRRLSDGMQSCCQAGPKFTSRKSLSECKWPGRLPFNPCAYSLSAMQLWGRDLHLEWTSWELFWAMRAFIACVHLCVQLCRKEKSHSHIRKIDFAPRVWDSLWRRGAGAARLGGACAHLGPGTDGLGLGAHLVPDAHQGPKRPLRWGPVWSRRSG